MTPMMPDAPEPQNRMMAPAMPAQGPVGGMGAPNGMMSPPNAMQAPAPPAAPPPSQAQIIEARQHAGAVVNGLAELTAKPRGDLSKKDVFDAASDMIAKGAFPSPSSKQELIAHLAGLPEDEPGLRKALGMFLLQASANRAKLHEVHGDGSAPMMAAPAMTGAPNAGV